jgi:hypothetical protein
VSLISRVALIDVVLAASVAFVGIAASGCRSRVTQSDDSIQRFHYGAQQIEHGDIEMSLARTWCLGECPIYTVTVRGNGEVTYTGEKFVNTIGERRWSVDPLTIQHMLDCFEGLHFMDLRDSYVEPVTDVPHQIITLHVSNKTKTIENAWSAGIATVMEAPLPDHTVHVWLDCLAFIIDVCAGTRPYVHVP